MFLSVDRGRRTEEPLATQVSAGLSPTPSTSCIPKGFGTSIFLQVRKALGVFLYHSVAATSDIFLSLLLLLLLVWNFSPSWFVPPLASALLPLLQQVSFSLLSSPPLPLPWCGSPCGCSPRPVLDGPQPGFHLCCRLQDIMSFIHYSATANPGLQRLNRNLPFLHDGMGVPCPGEGINAASRSPGASADCGPLACVHRGDAEGSNSLVRWV